MRAAIAERREAVIVLATGASQFETMAVLTAAPGITWDRGTRFHLDEYIGFPADHPASFRGYQRQCFLETLGGRARLHEIDGEAANSETGAARLSALMAGRTVDVCFAGLGENCHPASNDPPASAARPGPPPLGRCRHARRPGGRP